MPQVAIKLQKIEVCALKYEKNKKLKQNKTNNNRE